jgi:hypothetical protein
LINITIVRGKHEKTLNTRDWRGNMMPNRCSPTKQQVGARWQVSSVSHGYRFALAE